MKLLRISLSVCLSFLLLTAFALPSMAATNGMPPVDLSRETSLTLKVGFQDKELENAKYDLYRVGEMSKAGAFAINEPFEDVYDRSQRIEDAAVTLAHEAEVRKVTPFRTDTTNAEGTLVFDKLPVGLYLVVGHPVIYTVEGDDTDEKEEYASLPFLLTLPAFLGNDSNGSGGSWHYHVTAAPKVVRNLYCVNYWENYPKINDATVTDMPMHESFRITSDRLFSTDRPPEAYLKKSGSGDALRGDEPEKPDGYDKNAYLLADNVPKTEDYTFLGWNTDPDADTGYTSMAFSPDTYEYDVYAVWIKTADGSAGGNDGNSGSGESGSGTNGSGRLSATSAAPGSSGNGQSGDSGKKDPMLPQTGMLLWPVPLLAVIGLAALTVGSRGRNRSAAAVTGILFLSSAVCLVLFNAWDSGRANGDADAERLAVIEYLPSPDEKTARTTDTRSDNADSLTEMPVRNVNGTDFAALLEIPSLSLSLPVRNEWSYPGLRRSPCRYTGSAYTDDLVICGHNYSAHFGGLNRLQAGDEVTLEAMNGDVFHYRVAEVTTLSPNDYTEMTESSYDLTLFTCTLGGRSRVTVRCRLVSFQPHDERTVAREYVTLF